MVGVNADITEWIGITRLLAESIIGKTLAAAILQTVRESLPECIVGEGFVATIGIVDASGATIRITLVAGNTRQCICLGRNMEGLVVVGKATLVAGAVGVCGFFDDAELPSAFVAGGVAQLIRAALQHTVAIIKIAMQGSSFPIIGASGKADSVISYHFLACAGDNATFRFPRRLKLYKSFSSAQAFLFEDESIDAFLPILVGNFGPGSRVSGIVGRFELRASATDIFAHICVVRLCVVQIGHCFERSIECRG